MKVIGVLGGMGPEATADFFLRVVRLVPARRDQDHPRVIIDSNPAIPDRTAAVLGRGPSPVPALVETARNLERAGAELIAIPCNSAHVWYDEIAGSVRVPVLHMIRLTAQATRKLLGRGDSGAGAATAPTARGAGPPRALLLATTGTVESGIYRRAFEEAGLELACPSPERQAQVMEAIYHVKAGQPARARPLALEAAVAEVERLGPAAVVLGCTELPLILRPLDLPVPLVDSTEVLARAAVEMALQ